MPDSPVVSFVGCLLPVVCRTQSQSGAGMSFAGGAMAGFGRPPLTVMHLAGRIDSRSGCM